jgi:acyl carrier protein
MQEALLDGIREVLARHLDIRDDVAMSTRIGGDLALDSLQRTILVVELENFFEVCFDEDDEHGLETIADLVALIAARRDTACVDA